MADPADIVAPTPAPTPAPVKPFLKWAGGKTQLLDAIRERLPAAFKNAGATFPGHFFEPFMGSAAVFFALTPRLEPRKSFLSDSNRELVLTFVAVRDHLPLLLDALAEHDYEHNALRADDASAQRAYYEGVRAQDRQPGWNAAELSDPGAVVRHAARLIYLNKTCFNGLWRVNARGQHNVPMGRYKRPLIVNEPALAAAHAALQGVSLRCQPYGEALKGARAGDLVYLDPPYLPRSATSSFNAYAKEGFLERDHRELALLFLEFAARGVHVLLSNSDTPITRLPLGPKEDGAAFAAVLASVLERRPSPLSPRELLSLYRRHWRVYEVSARRAISAKATHRGAVTEILVSSAPEGCG